VDPQPLLYNTPTYQLQEPIIGSEPLLSNYQRLFPTIQPQVVLGGQMAAYPQVQMAKQSPSALLPQFAAYPSMQNVQLAKPTPKVLPELSKADLAKILLAMIAKGGDLEA